MKIAVLTATIGSFMLLNLVHSKIAHFWHITDFHYDPHYATLDFNRRQCRITIEERGGLGHHRAFGHLGDYSCDSPVELIKSALKFMRNQRTENLEFVLWTGDVTSSLYSNKEEDKYQAIRSMTELLRMTFSSDFVFPVLGDTDPEPSESLRIVWNHWLPLEVFETFNSGGYYTIEQTKSRLRIIALNTNLFKVDKEYGDAAREQWEWLDAVLKKATDKNEMVFIVGHAMPGSDNSCSSDTVSKYLRIVRQHAAIIAGQFFGHLHVDTFRVIYDKDQPVSWAFLAPSVSPRNPKGASNPGLRLYKFDSVTGKVLGYTQYYLDLALANKAKAEWVAEYNFTQYYGLRDISAESLHLLAEKLKIGTTHEKTTFKKYLRAYNVKYNDGSNCDGACAYQHFCAITCLEQLIHEECVEAARSALAAAGRAIVLAAPLVNIILIFIVCIVVI
ncbi:acid sphingomyelinase-like phosphodiesterase 3a [Maniola jurtina]|uniref:acid sphingomyelinase-like phosphodiesterase 3a n=1 Tax=Maniola jurtina TaxID=191418 RepID=UPI001E68EF2E|nr:acid sphingomyelinase-like phosphodiesterase 3a [Maniola jurtina]